ncbi:hypothetical protein HZ326_8737 [Fusarium oxysporum f. sp. albedinis]|nr:hypothetical protein HZ326_8737 [Fusarium oxysporum f. sp. albedinis]
MERRPLVVSFLALEPKVPFPTAWIPFDAEYRSYFSRERSMPHKPELSNSPDLVTPENLQKRPFPTCRHSGGTKRKALKLGRSSRPLFLTAALSTLPFRP